MHSSMYVKVMSTLSIVRNMSSEFIKKLDEGLTSRKPLELFVDKLCRCSFGNQYAITPFTCEKCTNWRPVFNFYMEIFDRNVDMMGNITMRKQEICCEPYRTISGDVDPFSALILSSHVVHKILPGYPSIRDGWLCGTVGIMILDQCAGIEEALKSNTPENIAEILISDLDKLIENGYTPSFLSYNSKIDVPKSVDDLLSFNLNTMKPCLPMPSTMFNDVKKSKYLIESDRSSLSISNSELREYIRNMMFVKKI